MKKHAQKIFLVIGSLTTLSVGAYLIFSLLDYVEKKVNYQPQTNPVTVPATSVRNLLPTSTPPSEDEDVFEQRQLRADSNNSTSAPKY